MSPIFDHDGDPDAFCFGHDKNQGYFIEGVNGDLNRPWEGITSWIFIQAENPKGKLFPSHTENHRQSL